MLFSEFNFDPALAEGIAASGYKTATPVQEQVIPAIMAGKDIIASAQTGTGKTAAFLLPIVNYLITHRHTNQVSALIVVPTRELSIQIGQHLEGLSYFTDISSISVYGGNDGQNFVAEKKQLEYILDKKIETNRQHFLKIKIPDYFQVLNKQEIKKDFSLGYPNISACRAGTTQAFYFFDLTKNEQTTLLIQPFSFMDATYQYYQKLDDNSITQIVEKQLEDIQKINGNFVSLFHNDLLQDKYVYKKILYLIKEY